MDESIYHNKCYLSGNTELETAIPVLGSPVYPHQIDIPEGLVERFSALPYELRHKVYHFAVWDWDADQQQSQPRRNDSSISMARRNKTPLYATPPEEQDPIVRGLSRDNDHSPDMIRSLNQIKWDDQFGMHDHFKPSEYDGLHRFCAACV